MFSYFDIFEVVIFSPLNYFKRIYSILYDTIFGFLVLIFKIMMEIKYILYFLLLMGIFYQKILDLVFFIIT